MLIHLLILGCTLGFSAAYNIDIADWYEIAARYMAAAQVDICAQAIIAGCVLILISVIMAQMNAYSLMLPLARLLLEVSLFGVSLLAFGALYFSWVLVENAWLDMGVAAMVPFLGVGTAGIALYIFDFNYPFMQKILGYIILTVFSLALVFVRVM